MRAEDTIKPGQMVDGHTVGWWKVYKRVTCPTCGAKRFHVCQPNYDSLHQERWAEAFRKGILK